MNYKLIRSNRRTVSISVLQDNSVTVRCPLTMSESRVEQFVNGKKEWIDRVIKANAKICGANLPVLEFKEVLIKGTRVPLIISDANAVTQSAVFVKSKSDIKRLYINYFTEELRSAGFALSEELNIPGSDFSVKAYKSRWGCCKRDGKIILNYLLAMLPAELLRYVIVHELCHIIYFNHSKEFWNLVGRFEPHYKILRNKLKAFNYLTNLY